MSPAFNPLFIRYIFRQPALRMAALLLLGSLLLCLLSSALWYLGQVERQNLARDISSQRKQQILNIKLRQNTMLAAAALQQLEALERMLALEFSQSEMARQLTALAEKNGLKVEAQTYAEKSPVANYIAYQQEIALTGSYSGLRRYLLDLQQASIWTEVSEMRIQRANNRPGFVQALLRVTGYKQEKSQ
jgi:hypothetical protein